MVVVTVRFGSGHPQEIEFETVPRVGEYIYSEGAYYAIYRVVHNFDSAQTVQVEVDAYDVPSSAEAAS